MGNHSSHPLHPPEVGEGGEGNAESSYHFTNHCTRSFRIERILIFANLAERQGEVKSRGYPPRDNHIKAPPSGSTFAFAPVSLHARPKKERKRTPTEPAKPPTPFPPPSGINRGPGNNKRKPGAPMGNDRLSPRD